MAKSATIQDYAIQAVLHLLPELSRNQPSGLRVCPKSIPNLWLADVLRLADKKGAWDRANDIPACQTVRTNVVK